MLSYSHDSRGHFASWESHSNVAPLFANVLARLLREGAGSRPQGRALHGAACRPERRASTCSNDSMTHYG